MRTASYMDETDRGAQAGQWLAAIRARVAPRPHLVLDPDRCALLIIDMLAYFVHPAGRCFLPAGRAIVPRVEALLECWRNRRGMVAFTRHGHRGPHDLGMLGRFFSDYIRADEPEAAIVDELAPLPGEYVFRKTTYDAFLGTGLEDALRQAGVTQVLVTGVLTHMCVETTARSAFCRGFEVYVPVDATASREEAHHMGSLLNMADAVAVMTSVEEVLPR
ncbi:cysteine hydrolase [Candidatus Fermentibacteria bacterium]|nr:cysteine hydrolase [Candidatus Fermentibacteria bacterium]